MGRDRFMYNPIIISAVRIFSIFLTLSTVLFLLERYFDFGKEWLWYGIPVLFLCLTLSGGVHWILLRRRGSHNWNVSNIVVKIEYQDDQGSEVHVTRSQTMYPNRAGVHFARISVSSPPEHGDIKLDRYKHWNPMPVPGSSLFGRTPSHCNVSKEWFREARGFYLLIQPEKSGSFPYPEFSGLLGPKKYPKEYFSLSIEGTTIYKDSYTEDEEYFLLKFNDPLLIDSLHFELILPATWSTCPDVNLFRINTKGFDKTQMSERNSDEKMRRFSAQMTKIRVCSNETLRVDWRRK